MIEVKLPAGPKDLRIKHFKAMSSIPLENIDSENLFQDDTQVILFLADFLNLKYSQVLDFTVKDIERMKNLALKAFMNMEVSKEPPKNITVAGQEFYLADPEKVGVGWHIDFKSAILNSAMQKDPVRLACLFYLPKGYNYSDVDENGNITHPISSRYELFREHFPLDVFIKSSGFFLRLSLESSRRSMVNRILRSNQKGRISLALKSLNLFSGNPR
jgi:hypothetical protein